MAQKDKKGPGLMEKDFVPEEYMIYGDPKLAEQSDEKVPEAERLLNEYESHSSREVDFIRAYQDIASKTKDPTIKFLLEMIISDEEKHHAIMHAMASSLRGNLEWTRPNAALSEPGELGANRDDFLKLTADFIKNEKKGITETKKLMKQSKGYYHGLFNLLLQSSIRDSEKHVDILDFLHKTVKKER